MREIGNVTFNKDILFIQDAPLTLANCLICSTQKVSAEDEKQMAYIVDNVSQAHMDGYFEMVRMDGKTTLFFYND